MERNFEDFSKRQLYIDGKLIEVQRQFVEMVDHRFRLNTIRLTDLECTTAAIFQYSALNFSIRKWQSRLDKLFHHIDQGNLGGKLTSLILSTDDLKIMAIGPKITILLSQIL